MLDIVVSGGLAVLPSGVEPADIGVAGEHIVAIGADRARLRTVDSLLSATRCDRISYSVFGNRFSRSRPSPKSSLNGD